MHFQLDTPKHLKKNISIETFRTLNSYQVKQGTGFYPDMRAAVNKIQYNCKCGDLQIIKFFERALINSRTLKLKSF